MSRSVPHLRQHYNGAYNPFETRVDMRWRCSVCQWAGIDPEVMQEPEQAVFSTIITGTTYTIPAGTPLGGLSRRGVLPALIGDPLGAPYRTVDGEAVYNAEIGDVYPYRTAGGEGVVFSEIGEPSSAPLVTVGSSMPDLNVFTQWGVHAGCPFCGSPNWAWANCPDLRW